MTATDVVDSTANSPIRELLQSLRIVALALVAAIGYGILHDQVTARICVEYFTIGHPPIFPTESPTLLAFGWGVIATWWVGLPLGILLSAAARAGANPKLTASDLRRPVGMLVLGMAACAAVAGAIGATLAALGQVWLTRPMSDLVPLDHQIAFLTDLWMHSASYSAGMLGGIALATWTWRRRASLHADAAIFAP